MTTDLRPGELATGLPRAADAEVYFLGTIRTPWATRAECPKRGDRIGGPPCRILVDPRWRSALSGVAGYAELEVLYWMHLARRDLVWQKPAASETLFGTFALRSPMRPNPISSSIVSLLEVEIDHVLVRGLDCVDGTPLVDIKPVRCPQWPTGPDDHP